MQATPATAKRTQAVFSLAVVVAALGYFVDIYDLLLFTIVREPSLKGPCCANPTTLSTQPTSLAAKIRLYGTPV